MNRCVIRKGFPTVVLFAASLFLAACTREEIPDVSSGLNNGTIGFEATVSNGWNNIGLTRSGNAVDNAPLAGEYAGTSEMNGGHKPIYLHAEITDYPEETWLHEITTRSTVVSSSDNKMYDAIKVSAYYYSDTWDDIHSLAAPNYFSDLTAAGSAGRYDLSAPQYWPVNGKVRFLSYAPAGDASYSYIPYYTGENESRGPYLHIKVPDKVEDQKDLLVAYTAEIACSGKQNPVDLNFKHVMTCVRFVCDKDMVNCRIKRVTIKNVCCEGDFIYDMKEADEHTGSDFKFETGGPKFNLMPTKKNFTQALDYQVKKEDNDYIITGETTFIMLPQRLEKGAEVQIVLQRINEQGDPTDKEEMIFGYIGGREWPAGKVVTYRVSYDNWWQQFSVTELEPFSPQGGEQTFRMTSFDISNEDHEKRPAPWIAEFKEIKIVDGTEVEDAEYSRTLPAWLTLDKTESEGDTDPITIKAAVGKIGLTRTIDMDAKLQNNKYAAYTKANPYNLAHPSGVYTNSTTCIQNTANCYVIDGPGWYILPLVYGNAITNGSDNQVAYRPNAGSADGVLNNFINHLGNEIISPYILNNPGCEHPLDAKMIWQDKQYLVQDVSLDMSAYGGKGGIIFQVPQASIGQGNSTIGLMSTEPYANDGTTSGDITKDIYVGKAMWSWHIWVTPFLSNVDDMLKKTVTVTNYAGNQYDLMGINLGWRSKGPVEIYNMRKCKIRFTATTQGGQTETKEIEVIQRPQAKYWHGCNTFYQWGRKDPFQPAKNDWNSMEWYDYRNWSWANAFPKSKSLSKGSECLKNRILFPDFFDMVAEVMLPSGSVEGYDETFYNLWDAANTSPNAINAGVAVRSTTVKTIYDPCPAGFKVPPVDAFTGFTEAGENVIIVDTPKNWNGTTEEYVYNDISNIPYIFIFYANNTKSENVTMPSMGYRDWRNWGSGSSAAPLYVGTDGYYWTAGAFDRNRGYNLNIMKGRAGDEPHVLPWDNYFHQNGYSIRPCKE